MSDVIDEQKEKKALLVALIRLNPEAKIRSSKKIETEIRMTFKESLKRMPWLVLENMLIVEE